MNRTLIRRLVASTAAAALISASSFLGAAGAYANPSDADATGIEASSTETPVVPESPMAEAPDETATPAADEAERKDGDGTEAAFDPQVTLSAAKATDITLTDKNSGIRVMVTGIKQDATVTDSLLNKTHTSTGDSLSYIMYSPKSPSAFSIGDTVTVPSPSPKAIRPSPGPRPSRSSKPGTATEMTPVRPVGMRTRMRRRPIRRTAARRRTVRRRTRRRLTVRTRKGQVRGCRAPASN